MEHPKTLVTVPSAVLFSCLLTLVGLTGCNNPMGELSDGAMSTPDGAMTGRDGGVVSGDGGTRRDGSVTPPGDGGVTPDGGRPPRDSGTILPPSSFRGIPERPYAGVALPATGTVEPLASRCVGTPEAPAFVIGDGSELTPPDDKWELLEARYCIIANVNIRGRILLRNAEMVEVRNVEVHHGQRAGISLGGANVAVVDSHIHHMQGNNGHAVHAGCGSSRIWVGENLLEYNDEDGFQSGHGCTGNEPDELYFYGNTCNNNRENCFDLKWTDRVVASGNVMRRHRTARDGEDYTYDDGSSDGMVNSGSDGVAVVIGSDGTPTTTFLFDNIYHDNMGCVRVEDAVDVYAAGEDCRDALSGARSGGYKFDKSGHTRLVSSTFTNVPFMITDDWRDGITVDEADNVLAGGTEHRQGFNATVTSGAVSETDVVNAYMAVFGRAP